MLRKISIILAVVLIAAPLFADEFSRSGTAGAQFLKIGVGARYNALGEASVATVDNVYGMYWNPAALTYVESNEVAFTHVSYLLDVSLNYVAYAKLIENIGVLGASVTVLSMNDQEITTIDEPDGTGETYSVSSFALQMSYARQLTEQFSFGLSFKYVGEQIYQEKANGVAFDFGTMLYTGFKSLRMGMNISNIGSDMQFDGPDLNVAYNPDENDEQADDFTSRLKVDPYDMPLTFRVGVAYDFEFKNDLMLTMAVEAKHPNDNVQQGSIGSEFNWMNSYFLRAGYKFNYEEEGLSLGGGLRTDLTDNTGLFLDYAWVDFGRLNSVHRFSASIEF